MGLLDNFNFDDPQTIGLLSAASNMLQASGPSRTPTSLGQVFGGGIQAYTGALAANKKQKMDEDQARQMALLRELQIQEAQGGLQDHALARKQADDLRNFYLNQKTATPSITMPQGMGGNLAPTVENAAKLDSINASLPQVQATPQVNSPYLRMMSNAQQLRSQGFHNEADAQEKAALSFKPKYSTTPQAQLGPDGKLHNYQFSEDGTNIDTGLGVKPDMTEVDLGGTKRFVDKNSVAPGQIFNKTQSPDSLASNGLGYARLNFDKKQAEGTQDDVMDPLAIRMTAQQYLAGDTSALQNFGRGAQGAKNLNAVRLEIAKQANSGGLNGSDIAAKIAEFGGLKAGQRTAGTRSANIEIAANEVSQLAPLALAASDKVVRSGFLPFGKAQVMFDSNTNDPNMRQFAMANTALVNAYGQAMSRGGSATVSDKDHAREMLATAFDQPSYAAAVAQLKNETRAAQNAPVQVKKDLSNGLTGRGASEAAPPSKPDMASMPKPNASNQGKTIVEHDTGKKYRSNGLQWVEVQ